MVNLIILTRFEIFVRNTGFFLQSLIVTVYLVTVVYNPLLLPLFFILEFTLFKIIKEIFNFLLRILKRAVIPRQFCTSYWRSFFDIIDGGLKKILDLVFAVIDYLRKYKDKVI